MSDQAVESIAQRKAVCSRCGGERNCDVFGQFDERGSDAWMDWNTKWLLMKCRGCDHVFVQLISTNSEDYDHFEDGDGDFIAHYREAIIYYPSQSKRKRPEWLPLVKYKGKESKNLIDILEELYLALDSDLHVLAAIGMRTSFDAASELLGVESELSFKEKLQNLFEKGHIGRPDLSRIEILVDAGNASAHRGWKASAEELNIMMDVLEHFLNEAFVSAERRRILDERTQGIRKSVPRRAKPSKTPGSTPIDVAADE